MPPPHRRTSIVGLLSTSLARLGSSSAPARALGVFMCPCLCPLTFVGQYHLIRRYGNPRRFTSGRRDTALSKPGATNPFLLSFAGPSPVMERPPIRVGREGL